MTGTAITRWGAKGVCSGVTDFCVSPFDEIATRVSRWKDTKPAHGLARAMICTCPAHNDKHPSLLVSETGDGRVLLHCRAGCTFDEVRQGLGLEPIDLIPEHLRYARNDCHRVVIEGPRFSAWQALRALAVDVITVAIAANQIRQQGWLGDADFDSLTQAVERIQRTIQEGGLSR